MRPRLIKMVAEWRVLGVRAKAGCFASAIATALSAATRPAQEGEQQQQPSPKEEQQWQRPFSSDEKGRPACEERPQIPADAEDQTAGRRADARAHSER